MPSGLHAVLAAMAANGGTLPAGWAAQALADSGADPRLLALLQQGGAADSDVPSQPETVDPPIEEDLAALDERCERLERLARVLHRRLIRLAGALGTCPRCVGTDRPGCRACNGTGAGPLDVSLFNRLIVPCVTRAAPHWAPEAAPAVSLKPSKTQGGSS